MQEKSQIETDKPTETITTSTTPIKPKRNKKKIALLIAAFLVVAGAAFAGAYFWQQSKVDNLTAQLAAANTKIVNLEKQLAEEQEQTVVDDTDETEYFEIEQLGVKFPTNDKLKGLYYVIENNGKTAYFSLDELKNTDCAADKTAQIALTRYTDADFASDPQGAMMKSSAKKIGNYYFFDVGGQAQCSDNTAVQSQASALKTELSAILPESLVPIN